MGSDYRVDEFLNVIRDALVDDRLSSLGIGRQELAVLIRDIIPHLRMLSPWMTDFPNAHRIRTVMSGMRMADLGTCLLRIYPVTVSSNVWWEASFRENLDPSRDMRTDADPFSTFDGAQLYLDSMVVQNGWLPIELSDKALRALGWGAK